MTRLRPSEWAVLVGFVLFVGFAVWAQSAGWSDDPDEDYAWLDALEMYGHIADAWALYLAEQEASDTALEDGRITGEQWREARELRRVGRAAGIRVFLAFMPDVKGEEETPLDRWYAAVETAKDWDAVDQWFQSQPADVRAYIERNIGPQETATEREHRELLRLMEETGFFAIADEAWRTVRVAAVGRALGSERYDTYRDFAKVIVSEMHRRLLAGGANPYTAGQEAWETFRTEAPISKLYSEERSYRRSVWATEHPQVALAGRKFGYIQ